VCVCSRTKQFTHAHGDSKHAKILDSNQKFKKNSNNLQAALSPNALTSKKGKSSQAV